MTGRGRGEQADHRFAVVAGEKKDEPLSARGDLFGEAKAAVPEAFAGQPHFAPIVANYRLRLQGRDQR